jgi:N-acetylneuraminic acid mutarotase
VLPPIQISGKRICVMAGNALATTGGTILLLGGDTGETFSKAETLQNNKPEQIKVLEAHPGFSPRIIGFDPLKKEYKVVGSMPHPSPVTTPCVVSDDKMILAAGEARAGVRTPKVWEAGLPQEQP